MASAFNEPSCSICELQHLTNKAEEWCPECDEYLCSNCKTHHKLAKSSRTHKTVVISDLEELPSFVFALKIKCSEHLENYEYFCPKHEIPICVVCAEEHSKCGKFNILRKLEGTKTSPGMIKLEQNIRDIQQNLEIFLQNRRLNLSKLKDQQVGCKEYIKEIRLKINQHLDKLEVTVNDEIDTSYSKHKTELEQIIDDLSARKVKMKTIQDDIEKIKDHASEIQTFLSIQGIQKDVKVEESQLVIIVKEQIKDIELSFLPAVRCTSGIILESFGELKTNIKRVNIGYVKQEDSEAQLIMSGEYKKDIDQISLTKKLDIALPTNLGETIIEGCCSLDDGFIFLADQGHKSRILVFKSNGAMYCEIPLEQKPSGVIYINKTVYVSSIYSMSLTSIDFETYQVKKSIATGYMCDALAVAGNKIILRLLNLEYRIYDQNLLEVAKIPLPSTYTAKHFSYFNEKIYISQCEEHTVNCYNMTGNWIWRFQHEDIRGPSGIANDNYGNLFVCCFYSKNILVISPDGKHSRNLLDLTGLLSYPSSIHYNHVSRQLIIVSSSNECNNLLVYTVS